MAAMPEEHERPKLPKSLKEVTTAKRLIVVLEQACLETVKTKKGYELLNCDDHLSILRKLGRDAADVRPDITHQLLLTLLDSPLNKAGLLQVFIQTQQRVLIEVNPQLRLPRTFKRFAGLIVQLLHKLRIRAKDSSETLMKVIKNPITAHLPAGALVIGADTKGDLIHPLDIVPTLPEGPVVFVMGAMAHGYITADYIERTYSFSAYPLSAATAVARLLNAFERHWSIL